MEGGWEDTVGPVNRWYEGLSALPPALFALTGAGLYWAGRRDDVAVATWLLLVLPVFGGAAVALCRRLPEWGFSYLGDRETEQIAVFQSAVERLLKGHPLGSAMEYFNGRYAAVSTELTFALDRAQWEEPDPYEVSEMWAANNDARGYIVIGDPAVRLPQATTAGA